MSLLPSAAEWEAFFVSAGIPSKVSREYAGLFGENRIRREFLGDLTKELLNEMGIKALGDVLAILKAAKRGFPEAPPKPKAKIAAPPAPPIRTPPHTAVVKTTQAKKPTPVVVSTKVAAAKATAPMERSVRPPSKSVLIIAKPQTTSEREAAAAAAEAKVAKARIRYEAPKVEEPGSDTDCAMIKAVREARKNLRAAPDADEYIVQMPKGNTAKSRELLRKAAALKGSVSAPSLAISTPPARGGGGHTVFTRLGNLEKKRIRLTRDASPEVSSTTSDVEDEEIRVPIKRKIPVVRLGLPIKKSLAEAKTSSTSSIHQRLGGKNAISSPSLTTSKSKGIFDRLG